MKFRIRLKAVHDTTGFSYYRVSKEAGVAPNTVKKYVSEDCIDSDELPVTVVILADYYGVDWRDPAIVEVIEEEKS